MCAYGHVGKIADCDSDVIEHLESTTLLDIKEIKKQGVMFIHVWGKKRPQTKYEEEDMGSVAWILEDRHKRPENGHGWFPFTQIYILKAAKPVADHPKQMNGDWPRDPVAEYEGEQRAMAPREPPDGYFDTNEPPADWDSGVD